MNGVRSSLVSREREHVPTQLEVLRGVLLGAAECGVWLTLSELAARTEFAEASISAQLRHLRKKEHGAYHVEKRMRGVEEALRTGVKERVWEYRVKTREVKEVKEVEEVKEQSSAA